MSDADEVAPGRQEAGEAAARLEAALERIARAAASGIIATGRRDTPDAKADAERAEIIGRLDALIARVHAALAESPSDIGPPPA